MEYTHVNPCAEDIYLFPSRKFLVRWLIGLDEEYWSENLHQLLSLRAPLRVRLGELFEKEYF